MWELIRYATKIVDKRNGHLEIFSLPQAIENVRQFLLFRTDILSLGAPDWSILFRKKLQNHLRIIITINEM